MFGTLIIFYSKTISCTLKVYIRFKNNYINCEPCKSYFVTFSEVRTLYEDTQSSNADYYSSIIINNKLRHLWNTLRQSVLNYV